MNTRNRKPVLTAGLQYRVAVHSTHAHLFAVTWRLVYESSMGSIVLVSGKGWAYLHRPAAEKPRFCHRSLVA